MRTLACLILAFTLLAGCSPYAPLTPAPPSPTTPATAVTVSTPFAPTPPPTAAPTVPPPIQPSPTPDPARLHLAEAQAFFKKWYRERIGPWRVEVLKEITPEEVWRQLHAQVFILQDDAPSTTTYLVYGDQGYDLGGGFSGQGLEPQDLLVTDLDQDGQPELVYGFSNGEEAGQAMRIGLFCPGKGQDTLLALEAAYPGRLVFHGEERGTLQVGLQLPDGGPEEFLGYLVLQDNLLTLEASPGQALQLDTYQSERFGVSFQYPAAWLPAVKEQADGEDQVRGTDGYFSLSPYQSVASGISAAYEGLAFDLVRACNWEINAAPDRYGARPGVIFHESGPTSTCRIIPKDPTAGSPPTLLFRAPTGGYAILHADPGHIDLLADTFRFRFPGGQVPARLHRPSGSQPPTLDLKRTQRTLGELTLEETSLFPETESTPAMEPLLEALAPVVARHAGLRKTNPWYLDPAGMIAHYNARLEPSGYHLEADGPAEDGVLRLFRGEQLVAEQLNLWSLQMDWINGPRPDFALQVEDIARHAMVLFRPGSEEVLDFDRYAWTGPVFAGERLATLEREVDEGGLRYLLKLDGETVYTFTSAFREPLVIRLDAWGDRWALEIDGTLVLDGKILNLEYGYGEIFFPHSLASKPFFFFEKGGQVGLWYAGRELAVSYDEVLHSQCCGAAFSPCGSAINLGGSDQLIWFFARRGGWWYYVEVGNL